MRASTRFAEETPMPAMSQRPSSPGALSALPTGSPPWEAIDGPPWAATDMSARGRPQPGRGDPPRGRPARGHADPLLRDPRGREPHGRDPRGHDPRASEPRGHDPRSRTEPPVRPAIMPASSTFTYAPADATPSTGSLPAITGGLIRREGTFNGRITRDGSSEFPAEPARYQLYASLGCPWSQRALIACRLLGLDRVIGLTLTDPVADDRGWRFTEDTGDPLTGARFVSDLYQSTSRGYNGPATVPLIWDLRTHRVVSNDVAQITVMLETEFRPFH